MRWIRVNYDPERGLYAIYWMQGQECVAEEGFIDPILNGAPLHQKDIDFITEKI